MSTITPSETKTLRYGLIEKIISYEDQIKSYQNNNAYKTAKEDLIKNKHINPKYIELELTESLLMKHLNEASDLLKELSDLGIHLAMDDFGTGYSSLSYLNQLPFHKLKIDRSFIAPILKNKQNKEIVKAIINLGHTIGLSVLAEGCENKKQFDVLKAMDCDSIQGFYLSKSLSSEDAEQLLYKYNQKQK